MKFQDLSPEVKERIASTSYDRIIEKHEGPASYKYEVEDEELDFIQVDNKWVLLPLNMEEHRDNITILRAIWSADGNSLTLFLRDATWYPDNDDWSDMSQGFMAVCDRMAGEEFYIAIVYHEWFII